GGVGAIPAAGLAGTDRRVVGAGSGGGDQRPKKRAGLACHGTRKGWVKTIHGRFPFQVQRFGRGEQATTWREQSQQVLPGQVSRRWGEFSASYTNRMSYEEMERLIERLTGER